jgi:hypothetical protein
MNQSGPEMSVKRISWKTVRNTARKMSAYVFTQLTASESLQMGEFENHQAPEGSKQEVHWQQAWLTAVLNRAKE